MKINIEYTSRTPDTPDALIFSMNNPIYAWSTAHGFRIELTDILKPAGIRRVFLRVLSDGKQLRNK